MMGKGDSYRERIILHQVRMVRNMQEKCSCGKGFVLFAIHISSDKGKDVWDVEVLNRCLVL